MISRLSTERTKTENESLQKTVILILLYEY